MKRVWALWLVVAEGCAQGALGQPNPFGSGADAESHNDETTHDGSSTDAGLSTSAGGSTSTAHATTSGEGEADSSTGPVGSDSGPDASDTSGAGTGATVPGSSGDTGDASGEAWANCGQLACDVGDCLTVTGLEGTDPFCSPPCVEDADCLPPTSGDAATWCALVAVGRTDPSSCVLVCEFDSDVLGTCPNGMTCTSVPDQNPPVSVCAW